jgi:LCP family protein required for cell wall assembly
MYQWVKVSLAVLIVVLGVVWLGIGFQLMANWTVPLGPALVFPEFPTPIASIVTPESQSPVFSNPEPLSLLPPRASDPLAQPESFVPVAQAADTRLPLCGGPEQMVLLAIGSDTRGSGYLYGLADVVRLVRIDFVNPSVTVLEFPRDLWVEIPGIADNYGITHEKLNQAYLYGNPGFGYYDGPDFGPGLLARTLYLNFGAWPDHYAAINMQTFVRLVDALGGVEVNLPYAVDGRMEGQHARTDLLFLPGSQRLKGREALMLARLRVGNNTDRSTHQSLIACALRDAALKPSNLARLPDIIAAFYGSVQTDLSPSEISALLCLMGNIAPGDIRFVSFPADTMQAGRQYDPVFKKQVFVFKADFEKMRTYTADFLDGTWPPPNSSIVPESDESGESFSCP